MSKTKYAILLVVALLLISACAPVSPEYVEGSAATVPAAADPAAATPVAAEAAPVAAVMTDTVAATDEEEDKVASDLVNVQGSSMATPIRITFANGQTTTSQTGNVTPEFSPQYLINILAGQDVDINLQSDGDYANFSVVGVTDGVMYKTAADLQDDFTFRTTRQQDYLITVVSPRPQNYTLTIYVAPLGYPTPAPTAPVEIKVPAGSTSTSVNGTTAPYGTNRYFAAAQGGQVMTVSLNSTNSVLRFEVTDMQTGQVLEPLNDPNPVWSGTLPRTGNFQIDVVSGVNMNVNYTLNVSFSPLSGGGGGGGSAAPIRITFAPNAVSASVSGTVVPPNAAKYVLKAGAGQTMTVSVSPYGNVGISVYGADGTVLQSPMGSLPSFTGRLPSTQDYIISLTSLTGSNVNFSMTVNVQ